LAIEISFHFFGAAVAEVLARRKHGKIANDWMQMPENYDGIILILNMQLATHTSVPPGDPRFFTHSNFSPIRQATLSVLML
jgi:hypothetical protein